MNHLRDVNGISPGLGDKLGQDVGPDVLEELEILRAENSQLRSLCVELEQALQEATQENRGSDDERLRDYEAMLEEKSDMIRQLHHQLQSAQSVVADLEAQLAAPAHPTYSGPAPREEELLALSEELERERRQLQEDEQTLMEQMREMEMTMARERAEMARQRHDLQGLQQEIQHEIERLERHGALQQKIEDLKNKLHDVSARRGMGTLPQNGRRPQAPPSQEEPGGAGKKEGFMKRLFGAQ